MAKAAKKSARKSATGRPFKKGGDARQGRGPKKGAPNAGRRPDDFKALCASLATREATLDAVTGILANPDHPQFMAALKWASENGYGRPAQAVHVSSPDGGAVQHEHSIMFGDRVIPF